MPRRSASSTCWVPTRRFWRLRRVIAMTAPQRTRPRNIRLTHEFVVNLVDEALAEAMNKCAASLPYGEDELQHAGLHPSESSVVKPPRIREAPVSFECKEWGTLQHW